MANLLKGVPVGKAISDSLKERIDKLLSKGIIPTVAVIRLGENPDDIFYESSVIKKFEKNNLCCKTFDLPKETSEEELAKLITEINQDTKINGVLMMRPLPKHINENRICNTLSSLKDADGITEKSMADLYAGKKNVFAPCTAQACIELLKYNNIDLQGKNIVVLGRSLVIGKPVAMLLLSENATVTVCHSKTKNIKEICKNADIIICAIGKAKYLTSEFVSKGQTVIDVGINYDANGNLCGDVDFDSVSEIVENISPVPAGVGSVTTSILMKHIVESSENINAF